MVSVSKLISTITSGISAVFDTSVSVEEQQQGVDQRVSWFVSAINEASYFNDEHQQVHGKDVLRRVEELGIALGADPDFSKETELVGVNPGGAVLRETLHAKSMSTSEFGFETNGTPYVRVPTYLRDGVEGYIKTLEALADKVEAYREDPSKVEEAYREHVDGKLKALLASDRAAYEGIVLNGGHLDVDGSNIMLANSHEGESYTSEDGSPITIHSATNTLLEREPAEEKLLEA